MRFRYLISKIFPILLFVTSSGTVFSQPASSVWVLKTDQSPTVIGNVTATSQQLINMQATLSTSGSDTVVRTSPTPTAGTWPAQSTEDPTRYMQFAVSPAAGYLFTANSFSMILYVNSGSFMEANVYYSKDPTFSTKTQVGSTFSLNYTILTSPNITAAPGVTVNSGETFYVRVYPWNTLGTSGKYVIAKTVTVSGTVNTAPSLVATPASLTGFSYTVNSGPSTSQHYNLSGTNLTGAPGNITVTAPGSGDYEVSNNNTTWGSTTPIAYTSATLNSTPVYVRLKTALSVGNYNSESITIAGGGASNITVACSGTVNAGSTPNLVAVPASLTGFSYTAGSGPSPSQSYNLSGTNLTGAPGNITVTGSSDYEVSNNNTTWGSSTTIAYANSTLSSTSVYIRLKAGISAGIYNSEIIGNAGGGASTINVTCSGTVNAAGTLYVDPVAGLDTNPGTIGLPLKTIGAADTRIGNAGGYIYLRGGTYSFTSKFTLSHTASALSTIKIWAYNNEIPLIDFAGEPIGGSENDGISLTGDYYHLKGLEIIHAGHNGISCTGHYNTIEACRIHSNNNSGFQMGGGSNSGAYPSHNLILNTDSYLNFDAPIGGNADGFSPKWYIGKGNVFRGCRAWQNSDDGWDLWMADSTVEIDSCFAFRNGVNSWGSGSFDGNGNGFKLGGNNVATPHTVKNCVSFDNAGGSGRGYDENNNTAGLTIYNCVAYRNMGDDYHFKNDPITGLHIIENCISYSGIVSILNATLSNNSWPGLTPSASDFVSLDTSLASAPRQANGNLPDNGFFRLKAGSKFINAGINVGIPFSGSAPDIGAFEYGITLTLTLTAIMEGPFNGTVMENDVYPLTVTVELRDANTHALVESKTGELSPAGVGTFSFTNASNGTPYYITVSSPTTSEVQSATAQSFTAGALSYNFTTALAQAYTDGGGVNQMILKGGKWCIFSGDVNQDGAIDAFDLSPTDNDNVSGGTPGILSGLPTDVTCDGGTDAFDLSAIDNNNTRGVYAQLLFTPQTKKLLHYTKPKVKVMSTPGKNNH